ncbi:MAG: peptidylprolyl isomerase [Bacteroidales bacterium]|jgi:peptidyl-prolyl cis-trans isomerase SurA|nr:peptidylprolyl isomerase [Bacteroidales bacterium]
MKKLAVLLLFVSISSFVFSQKDSDILLEVGKEKISKETFLEMFQRNNPNKGKKITPKEVDDYLELFINFKLKLIEAKEMGLDTLPSYIEEVSSYRKQLVEPYLNDKEVTEELINEAYQRSKEILRASHILITIPSNATPEDTLEDYKKAMDIRKKLLKGEDFSKLALAYSEDPSAKKNKGDLGYFTSFSMIYPFETACYALKVGEVSMPIRSQMGYHIIKLTDRKPTPFYTCSFAHIWIKSEGKTNEEAKAIIDSVYNKLQENVSFDSLAKQYSEDTYSSARGGVLTNQKVYSIPAEYTDMLISTPKNEYSKPFQSRYGWHIIKPISFTELPSLEKQRPTIEQRISKDARSYKTIEHFVQRSKEEYNFKENLSALDSVIKILNDSIFEGNWVEPKDFLGKEILFTIGNYSFSQKAFADILEKQQRKTNPQFLPSYVSNLYERIVNEKIIEYADSHLEEKYPDLKITVDEFRDGILIFSITDKLVWNRSVTDSLGLEDFYKKNANKYMWKERVDATLWVFDKKIDYKKAKKIIEKQTKKKKTDQQIKDILAEKFKIDKDTINYFNSQNALFEKSDNKIIDNIEWKEGVSQVIDNDNKGYIVVIHKVLSPTNKTLDEAKGIVISDYQEYLEKLWIENLRSKYPYKVNEEVLKSITEN